LKWRIAQLKKDRIIGANGHLSEQIDIDLDRLIEENLRLQREDHDLTAQVKELQKRKRSQLAQEQK